MKSLKIFLVSLAIFDDIGAIIIIAIFIIYFFSLKMSKKILLVLVLSSILGLAAGFSAHATYYGSGEGGIACDLPLA